MNDRKAPHLKAAAKPVRYTPWATGIKVRASVTHNTRDHGDRATPGGQLAFIVVERMTTATGMSVAKP
jgi:hypothetical protein